MNSYFVVPLDNNSFDVDLQYAECHMVKTPLSGTIKIDTGCAVTRLNLKTMLPRRYEEQELNNFMKELKYRDIQRFRQGKIKCRHSIGVNTVKEELEEVENMADEDILKDRTICFHHNIRKLVIGGCYIGDTTVKINYDSTRDSLLGMNVLKNFECYCGTSLIDDKHNAIYKGDYVFLGKVREDKDIKYINALNEYFGIYDRLQNY